MVDFGTWEWSVANAKQTRYPLLLVSNPKAAVDATVLDALVTSAEVIRNITRSNDRK